MRERDVVCLQHRSICQCAGLRCVYCVLYCAVDTQSRHDCTHQRERQKNPFSLFSFPVIVFLFYLVLNASLDASANHLFFFSLWMLCRNNPHVFFGVEFLFFFVCVDEGSARAAMVHLVGMGSLFQDLRRWSHLPDPPLHGHGQRLRNPRAKHPLPNLQHAGKINSNKNQMDLKYANFIFFGGENFRL